MKRLITCTALVLVAAVVVFAAVRERSVLGAGEQLTPASATGGVSKTRDGYHTGGAGTDALRQEYVEQLLEKATLMKENEIHNAIAKTAAEVSELRKRNEQRASETAKLIREQQAAEALDSALTLLVAQCEGTRAGEIAEEAIYRLRYPD